MIDRPRKILTFKMNRSDQSSDESRFEAYLDNALDHRELAEFEERLRSKPNLRKQVELQQRINRSLGSLFPVVECETTKLLDTAEQIAAKAQGRTPLLRRRLSWIAAAAAAGVMLALYLHTGKRAEPFFRPAPLVQVYHAAVRQGFEPYYECEDDERFARVFQGRQGRALQLLPMPQGCRMLGLSYPGGLSRDTTAMLCRIDGEPVMVFVDRQKADQPDAAYVPEEFSGTYVFKQERDGLVFYEVTPYQTARALRYLVVP